MEQASRQLNKRKMTIMGLVGFIITAPFIIFGVINQDIIKIVVSVLVLAGFIYWGSRMKFGKNDLSEEAQGLNMEGLVGREKTVIIIFSLLAPVFTGAIMYYVWIKKFPKKARQANLISWIVALIYISIYIAKNYLFK